MPPAGEWMRFFHYNGFIACQAALPTRLKEPGPIELRGCRGGNAHGYDAAVPGTVDAKFHAGGQSSPE